jgi:hypothetical protein
VLRKGEYTFKVEYYTMEHLQEFLIPYIISNIVAVLILLAAWKLPRLARLLFAILFGWAAWMNSTTAINTPEAYLEYADMSIPLYSKLINGWFSQHITPMVLLIASGQLMIAIGMLLKGMWVKLACVGAIIFLLAIAPLGVGSGFPFSLFAGLGAYLIFRQKPHLLLWKKNKITNSLVGAD